MSAPPIDLKLGSPDQIESFDTPASQPTGHMSGYQVTSTSENCRAAVSTSQTNLSVGSQAMSGPETEVTSAIHSVAKSTSCANLSNKDEEKEEWTSLSEEEKEEWASLSEEDKESLDLLQTSDTPTGQPNGCMSGYLSTSTSENCSTDKFTPQTIISFDATAALAPHNGIILGGPNITSSPDPPNSQPIGLDFGTPTTSASQICSTAISTSQTIFDAIATSAPHSGILLGGPNTTRSSDPPTNQQIELDSGNLASSASHICSIASSSPQTIISSGTEHTSTAETGLVSRTLTVSIPCTSISVASTVQSKFGVQSAYDLSGLRVETSIPSLASLVTVRPVPSDIIFRSPFGFSFGSPPATSRPASSGLPIAIALTSSITFGSSGLGSPAGSTSGSLFATGRPLTSTQPTFSGTSSSSPLGLGTITSIPSTGLSEPIKAGSTGIDTKVATTTSTGTLGGFGTSLCGTGFGIKAATTTTTGMFADLKTTSETASGSSTPVLGSSDQQSVGWFSKPHLGVVSTTATPVFSIGTTTRSDSRGASIKLKLLKASGTHTTIQRSSNRQSKGSTFSKPADLGAVSTATRSGFSFSTTTTSNSLGTSTLQNPLEAAGSVSFLSGLRVVSTTTGSLLSFSNTITTTSNPFGASMQQKTVERFGSDSTTQTMGTPIMFIPPTDTDTMVRSGVSKIIYTRLYCITLMKEYRAKSLEELRLEDYVLNRKGPRQAPQESGVFSTSIQSSLFGSAASIATSGGSLFTDKPLFGELTTLGFGSGTGVFSSSNQQSGSLFDKPAGFGAVTTSTATGFSFNTTTTTSDPFGVSTQPKLFGGFGSGTGVFSSSNQQSESSFGKPTDVGAVTTTAGIGFSSLFGKPTGIGAVTTTTRTVFSSSFGKPIGVGAVTTITGTGFSFNTTSTSNSFDGSTQPKLFGGFKATTSKNVETDPIQQLTDIELSKIWSILECPVCLDVVLPPVYQCETGHHACNSCWENLSSCPLCKSRKSTVSRNFVAEAIVELVKLPCRYRVDGCKNTVLLTKKLEHEKVCPHHKFECPVSYCRDKQNYQTVSGHLSQKHGLVVTEVTDNHEMRHKFSKTIEIKKVSSLIHGFLIPDWGLFLLCSKTTESKTLLWMQMLAAPGKSSSFTYKIDVVDHLDRHGVSYTGTVMLFDKSVDEIQEDDCLHMIDIMLKSLQINCLKITMSINAISVGFPLD